MKQKKQNQTSGKAVNIFCDITSRVQSPCCKILESISDGVFTINADKRITSFNRTTLWWRMKKYGLIRSRDET